MNKAILIGRLTKDPEIRYSQSGVAVCNFTVAIDRKYNDQNGNKQTDFLNCVAWRERAEFIDNYFTKGRRIGVEGTIQTRDYQAQDGTKRYVTEILVESVEFVDSNPNSQNGNVNTDTAYHSQPQAQTRPAPTAQPTYQQTRMDSSGFYDTGDDDQLPF